MEDIETLLAVMRAGSLEGAARELGVNHSTVYRRLGKLEARSGGSLFERNGAAYVPTALALALFPVAERLVHDRAAFERTLMAQTDHIDAIRVSLPYPALSLLREELGRFRVEHPDVTLSVKPGGEVLDLSRGDADVAVRMIAEPEPELVGRRLADLGWAAYSRVRTAPEELPWVTYDERLQHMSSVKAWRRRWPRAEVAYAVSSPAALLDVLRADDVVGYCPCYVADQLPELHRVSNVAVHGGVWVLYPSTLRRCPTVRAFVQVLYDAIEARQALFEGRTRAFSVRPVPQRVQQG